MTIDYITFDLTIEGKDTGFQIGFEDDDIDYQEVYIDVWKTICYNGKEYDVNISRENPQDPFQIKVWDLKCDDNDMQRIDTCICSSTEIRDVLIYCKE